MLSRGGGKGLGKKDYLIKENTVARYILHPGFIISASDGDRHYIGAAKLAKLYGLPLAKCIVITSPRYQEQDGDVHLRPRYDGDYNIKEESNG